MNRAFYAVSVSLALGFMLLMVPLAAHATDGMPRISAEALSNILDDPGLALLDTRIGSDWDKSDAKIKGAVRVDPRDIGAWASNYRKDQKIVLYCA